MTIYTITPDSIITAHATEADAKSITQAEQFSSAKELAKAAAQWPSSHLVEIWNSLPGDRAISNNLETLFAPAIPLGTVECCTGRLIRNFEKSEGHSPLTHQSGWSASFYTPTKLESCLTQLPPPELRGR